MAHAAGWKLESSSSNSLQTDGESFAVWDGPTSDRVTILDTDTGERRITSVPGNCLLVGGYADDPDPPRGVAAGRALLVCRGTTDEDETDQVLDLRTGALTVLPTQAPPQGAYVSIAQYRDLGAHWAKATRSTGCDTGRCQTVYRYFNLDTGQQVEGSQDVVDLDAPTLPTACGRLRTLADRDGLLGTSGASSYDSLKRGRTFAVRRLGCSTSRTVAREHLPATSFQAAGGLVSWTTARDATEFDLEAPRRKPIPAIVAITSTTGGPVRRWRAPVHTLDLPDRHRTRGSFGIVAHTRRRLFFLASLRVTPDKLDYVSRSAVYSRPLTH